MSEHLDIISSIFAGHGFGTEILSDSVRVFLNNQDVSTWAVFQVLFHEELEEMCVLKRNPTGTGVLVKPLE